MTDVPGLKPETSAKPDAGKIVATAVLLLLHTPPDVGSLKRVVVPTHKVVAPEMGAGALITETVVVATHPTPSEYVMAALPALTPDTTPEVLSTVATAVLALVQVPPEVPLLNGTVEPRHTLVLPEIDVGNALTVTTLAAVQPEDNV